MRLKGGQLSPTDWGREGEWIEQSFHRAKGREPSILSLTPLFATHLKFAQVESTSKENKASRVASSPEFGGSPWLYIPCQLRVKEQYAPIKGMNSLIDPGKDIMPPKQRVSLLSFDVSMSLLSNKLSSVYCRNILGKRKLQKGLKAPRNPQKSKSTEQER